MADPRLDSLAGAIVVQHLERVQALRANPNACDDRIKQAQLTAIEAELQGILDEIGARSLNYSRSAAE